MIGPAACSQCPDNAISDSQTARIDISQCYCEPGYQGTLVAAGDTCAACEADTYKSALGTVACAQCTNYAGTNGNSAQTAVSDCICEAGFTSDGVDLALDTTCVACGPGKVKPVVGKQHCSSCMPHSSTWKTCSTSSIASGKCSVVGEAYADVALTDFADCKCNMGYTGLLEREVDQCSACPLDTYKSATGPGTGSSEGYLCATCTTFSSTNGTFANTDVSDCLCNPGYDGDIDDTGDVCSACAVDNYKPQPGNAPTMCGPCPGGFNTNGTEAAVACFCDPGFEFVSTGDQGPNCYPCLAGYFKEVTGFHPCTSCPANSNTYTNTPAGFMNQMMNNPRQLQEGSVLPSACKCDPGYRGAIVHSNSVCSACGSGKYKREVGDSGCVSCTEYAVTTDVASTAVYDCLCRPGYSGSIVSPTSECTECPHSKYKAVSGTSPCISCPAHSGTCDNNGDCTSHVTTVRECECDPGWYGRLLFPSSVCGLCRANTYKEDHSINNCNICPAGSQTFGLVGSTFAGDCECDVGHVGVIRSRYDSCRTCSAGTYKGSRGEQLCTICPENMVTDPSNISVSVRDCFCAPGYVPRPDESGEDACVRCERTMADLTGCGAFPPEAFVAPLEHQLKVSPTKKVPLMGTHSTLPDPNEPVTFVWQAWQELPDNSSLPMDISAKGFLAGTLTGTNLIVRAGSLDEGKSYRFRLIVTGSASKASASADSIFTVNLRPINGTLSVSPTVGVALEDRFTLTAAYWYDEDLPLVYKYGFEIRSNRKWLTTAMGNATTKAMLPPGSGGVNVSSANFTNITSTDGSSDTYELLVRVADAYDASMDARTNVTVMPYVKVEGVSWADDMLSKTTKLACSPLRCGRTGKCNNAEQYCAPFDEEHEVRCCADAAIPQWRTPRGDCSVWGESDASLSCQHALNYDDAVRFCQSAGSGDIPGRLCTAAELEADCTRGTGCGHDNDLIWSNIGDDDEDEIDESAANTVAALTLNSLDTSEEDVATEEIDVDAACTSPMTCAEFHTDFGGWPAGRGSPDVCAESDNGFGYASADPENPDDAASDEDPREECLFRDDDGICVETVFSFDPRQNREWRSGTQLVNLQQHSVPGVECKEWDGDKCIDEMASWSIYANCNVLSNTHDDHYELRGCRAYHGAVCAALCASVSVCQGFQIKANHAGHCLLFEALTPCDGSMALASEMPCSFEDDICLGGYCAELVTSEPHRKPVAGLPNWNPSLRGPDTTAEPNKCVDEVTWSEAVTTCIGTGGRLCSQAELQANEAAGTGCQFDTKLIWTADDVECEVGKHMLVPGKTSQTVQSRCGDDASKNAVRCCADIVATDNTCIDPNAPVDVGLTDDLANARQEMINNMGDSTTSASGADQSTMASGAVESLTGSPEQLTDDSMDASQGLLQNMVGSTTPSPSPISGSVPPAVSGTAPTEISGTTPQSPGTVPADVSNPPQSPDTSLSGTTPQVLSGSVPPEVSKDGSQAMVSASSNILGASNQAAERAKMVADHQALEAERLAQKATCRAQCLEDFPPVEAEADECLEFGVKKCKLRRLEIF